MLIVLHTACQNVSLVNQWFKQIQMQIMAYVFNSRAKIRWLLHTCTYGNSIITLCHYDINNNTCGLSQILSEEIGDGRKLDFTGVPERNGEVS